MLVNLDHLQQIRRAIDIGRRFRFTPSSWTAKDWLRVWGDMWICIGLAALGDAA